jgi:dTDP-4-dehydrorhamnose reductase
VKILLTGANGLLGSAIQHISLEKGHECLPLPRKTLNWLESYTEMIVVDDADVVIHAAANTDVEQCEAYPDICYRDNYLLSEHIAALAARANKKFVFISSTGVYGDHKDTPYCEFDDVQPTTHYHKSKILAENSIQMQSNNSLIVRTGWLFGSGINVTKNFISKRVEEARNSSSGVIFANKDQFGNPSYNIDVARRIIEFLEFGVHGVFNCVNSQPATRFEYVKKIIEFSNLNVSIVESSADSFNRIANVSNNESAFDWKAQTMGFNSLPDWRWSLMKYMRDGTYLV